MFTHRHTQSHVHACIYMQSTRHKHATHQHEMMQKSKEHGDAKEGELCVFPEEARKDTRYVLGGKCPMCGGIVPHSVGDDKRYVTHMHICVYVCIYVCMYRCGVTLLYKVGHDKICVIHTHLCVYVCVCVSINAIHTCVYVCVFMYLFIYVVYM
jgi:hypothetical protein